MASVNKVILVGNCGRDPEVRYLPSGKATCNISVATSSKRKDKNGEYIEETQWHRVTFFDKLAEIAGQYVKKGSPVYVEGSIKYGKYTDKDGVEKSTVDIVASSLQMLGKADDEKRPSHDAAKARQLPAKSSGFDDMSSDLDDPPF